MSSPDQIFGASEDKYSLINFRQKPSDMTVVTCGLCRIPLGNVVALEERYTSEEVMPVTDVTQYVRIDKDSIYSESVEGGSYHMLFCENCSSSVGKYYTSTTKHLDYRRKMYCFDLSVVERYTLGSTEQRLITNEQPLTLEKVNILNTEITMCKLLFDKLQDQITEIRKKSIPK